VKALVHPAPHGVGLPPGHAETCGSNLPGQFVANLTSIPLIQFEGTEQIRWYCTVWLTVPYEGTSRLSVSVSNGLKILCNEILDLLF
jgi:hypothetical protein